MKIAFHLFVRVFCFLLELWQHFSKIYCVTSEVQIQGFIVCNDCKRVLKYTSSNVLLHIKKHVKPKQTIDDFFGSERGAQLTLGDKELLLEASVNFVCKDLRPYASLEGEGMLDIAHAIWNLGAKYGAMSKDQIRSILPSAVTVSRHVKKKSRNKEK